MSEQKFYRVLPDEPACAHCKREGAWSVGYLQGSELVCIGQSFDDRERAEDLCDHMNEAFERGQQTAKHERGLICLDLDDMEKRAQAAEAKLADVSTKCGQLHERLAASEAKCAETATDAARLNWLEAHGCGQFFRDESRGPDRLWFDCETPGKDYAPSFREAIDAAMAHKQETRS